MLKNKKIILGGCCLLFILAIGYCAHLFLKDETQGQGVEYIKLEVMRSNAGRNLNFRGILKSSNSTPVVALTRGRITELAKQGSAVKKGDVLFQIDDSTARENIENQETSLDASELNIEQLKAQYDLVKFQQDNNVRQCQEKLDHARLEEREELAKPDARDLRLMEIAEKLAQLDVEDAEDAYEREKRMYEKKYITLSALEPYQMSLENAKATLEELIIQNNITRKGATAERRVELRKAVERAEANLQRSGLHRKRKLEDISTQIEAETKNLEVIKFNMKRYQGEIDNSTVLCPVDGVFMVVTYRDWSGGGVFREINIGDEMREHDVIGYVIDPTSVQVRMAINEADFPFVRENMDVKISFPAIQGKVFDGKLSQIGAIGKDRDNVDPTAQGGGYSEVSVFNATVDVKGDGTRFHPGMSAIVTATVSEPEDALFLPRCAVIRKEDGRTCVMREAAGELHPIRGRDFNEMLFKVEQGLEEGDIIYYPVLRQSNSL